MAKFTAFILALCSALALPLKPLARKEDDRMALRAWVAQLKDSRTSEAAVARLEELVGSDPALRCSLINDLRPMIRGGPAGGKMGWMSSIKVAGDLKLVELSPDLAAWVDRLGSSFLIGPLKEQFPAQMALVAIGDPAIPALEHVGITGTCAQRDMASLVLWRIGTAAARRSLGVLVHQETDPQIKERIEKRLESLPQKP